MPTTRRGVLGGNSGSGGNIGGVVMNDLAVPPSTARPVMTHLSLESSTTSGGMDGTRMEGGENKDVALSPSSSSSTTTRTTTAEGTTTESGNGTIATTTTAATGNATTGSNNHTSTEKASSSLSLEERYETERYNLKVKHWKESPFAVGLTEVSWQDEKSARGSGGGCCDMDGDHHRRNRHRQLDYEYHTPRDPTGCLCISGYICSLLGAGRVGNLIVLKQSIEKVEQLETIEDEETGQPIEEVRIVNRPKLQIVIGPYWPMLCFVTYPLIISISMWTFLSVILPMSSADTNDRHQSTPNGFMVLLWFLCTMGLILALSLTACRDPGVLYRYPYPPNNNNGNNNTNTNTNNTHTNQWRWNDQAQTYRPRGASYDPDTAVVVEDFDHTCPWTGTAIGKKNMLTFQIFVCLVFVCMILDILLLAGVWR